MKISKEKLRKLIREERASSKMYRKYDLGGIARDERRHARHLNRLLKRISRTVLIAVAIISVVAILIIFVIYMFESGLCPAFGS